MKIAVTLSDRMRRGDLMSADCPSRDGLKHVTGRWDVLVLIALEGGTCRFGALRRAIGKRMQAHTLQWLEADSLVLRTAHAVVPPRVDYALTPLGVQAAERVRLLADWIENALPAIMDHRRSAA